MKAKLTFPVSNGQTSRLWRTGDAICQGPHLSMNPSCAKLDANLPVIRWMSFKWILGGSRSCCRSLCPAGSVQPGRWPYIRKTTTECLIMS